MLKIFIKKTRFVEFVANVKGKGGTCFPTTPSTTTLPHFQHHTPALPSTCLLLAHISDSGSTQGHHQGEWRVQVRWIFNLCHPCFFFCIKEHRGGHGYVV